MANEWHRANRLKRGGGLEAISIAGDEAETRYLSALADPMTPEKAYDREWALALLARVLTRLEQEYAGSGAQSAFQELKVFLTPEGSLMSYSEIAQKLGLAEGNLRVKVHRLRQRYATMLRRELAETVDTPEAVEEELRHLFSALS